MFARLVVFGQSVFSPERKPMTLQYRNRAKNGAQATKPVIKSIKAAARAEDITSVLGTDELDLVLMAVYQSCKRAPMCAAVSRARYTSCSTRGCVGMLSDRVVFPQSVFTPERSQTRISALCESLPRLKFT
jgi:hypothetical protein